MQRPGHPGDGGLKTFVEFTHRLTSGAALLLVVWLVVRAFRSFPKGHRVRRGAAWTLAFILVEALIGAALVKYGLVVRNDSVARAVVMAGHLVNTFLLLAAATLTAWWATGGAPLRLRGQGNTGALFAVALLGALLLAVSGAVTALGDTLFPVGAHGESLRQTFVGTEHFLKRLRTLHPAIAVVVGCYAVMVSSYVGNFLRPGQWVKKFGGVQTALFVAQLAVGIANVLLHAPVWLQLVHLFLADLFWIALVLTASAALADDTAASAAVEQHALRPVVEV